MSSATSTATVECRSKSPEPELDHAAELFDRLRPKLFGVAYRMLHSVSDAEDVVQDVWVRWQLRDRSVVRDHAAFLVTTTTRLCINVMQSARVRRETHLEPWHAEPVDTTADPALRTERAEQLGAATLALLQRLSTAERAAYVLREAFDYPYDLIGATIGVSAVNARQLVSRARRQLTARDRPLAGHADHAPFLTAFVTAARTGHMRPLETFLATADHGAPQCTPSMRRVTHPDIANITRPTRIATTPRVPKYATSRAGS